MGIKKELVLMNLDSSNLPSLLIKIYIIGNNVSKIHSVHLSLTIIIFNFGEHRNYCRHSTRSCLGLFFNKTYKNERKIVIML